MVDEHRCVTWGSVGRVSTFAHRGNPVEKHIGAFRNALYVAS